jgi:hypothetical protein
MRECEQRAKLPDCLDSRDIDHALRRKEEPSLTTDSLHDRTNGATWRVCWTVSGIQGQLWKVISACP